MSVLIVLFAAEAVRPPAASAAEGVVVAARDDPLRALAKEISADTGYPLLDSPTEALETDPTFLIWVADPTAVSDSDFVAYGQAVKDRASIVSLGIITGRALQKARALWERRREVSNEQVAALNGRSPAASVFAGRIVTWPEGQRTAHVLSLESAQQVLQRSDYVTFSGHGSPTALFFDGSTALRAGDVPPLPPVVVGTSNCSTLRFWRDGSIALAFVDQGAAAYAGFVYSPNAGYLMGAHEGMAFRYTWPEFPIGHVVEVLNRGCRQGFAVFPQYHLIGDPRIALADRPPYEIVEDTTTGDRRRIVGRGAPPGVIPVRVANGARYAYVHVPSVAAASVDDWFYNSRLQMANLDDDKLILLLHPGGDFTLDLRASAPLTWKAVDTILDSLDHNLVYLNRDGGDVLQLIVGGIACAVLVWRYRQRGGCVLLPAALSGLAFALLLALYVSWRVDDVTINSKPVAFCWLALPACFLLVAGGSLLYVNAKSWRGRVFGLLLASAFQWATALGTGLFLFAMSALVSRRVGSALWNYQLALPNLVAFLVIAPFLLISFAVLRRRVAPQHNEQQAAQASARPA